MEKWKCMPDLLGPIPALSHTAAGEKPHLHRRRLHWEMQCQRWWLDPWSLQCPQPMPPFFSPPALLARWWDFATYISLNIIHGPPPDVLLGLTLTLHINLQSLPTLAKSAKARHHTSELAPGNLSPTLAMGRWLKGRRGRTPWSVISWTILQFAGLVMNQQQGKHHSLQSLWLGRWGFIFNPGLQQKVPV